MNSFVGGLLLTVVCGAKLSSAVTCGADSRSKVRPMVSTEIVAACDGARRIAGSPDLPDPERPGGEDERSLNAHVAAAIAFHEVLRGREVD